MVDGFLKILDSNKALYMSMTSLMIIEDELLINDFIINKEWNTIKLKENQFGYEINSADDYVNLVKMAIKDLVVKHDEPKCTLIFQLYIVIDPFIQKHRKYYPFITMVDIY